MKEKIVSIRGAFDDIVDSWCLQRIIPDEALDSLKKCGITLNQFIEQWYAQLEDADSHENHECDCEFEYTDYYIGYWCLA